LLPHSAKKNLIVISAKTETIPDIQTDTTMPISVGRRTKIQMGQI
jgi:hypothetical protein